MVDRGGSAFYVKKSVCCFSADREMRVVLFMDLHTHSTASDGTDSPAALVAKAAGLRLAAVALTDHDTVSGLDEAVEEGRKHPIEVVRGCEIAVASPYGEVHLLGLWLPERLPVLGPALEVLRQDREERNRLVLGKLAAAGFSVAYEDLQNLAGGDSLGRLHIARLLVKKKLARSAEAAFAAFLAEGRPTYVPRKLPDPEQGLAMLQAEGATTVFAHPMLLRAPGEWLNDFVADLSRRGLDALEAYHADHTPQAVRRCLDLASHHGLALSGGSDYHGEVRGRARLGGYGGRLRVPLAIMEQLKTTRRRKNLPVYGA